MAITSGTYNFGPGETLTNFTDIAREINRQTLSGNLTFVQTGDVVQTSAIDFQFINSSGYTLRFTSNYNHEGSFNKGWKISNSGITSMFNFINCSFSYSSVLSSDACIQIDNQKICSHIVDYVFGVGGFPIKIYNNITSGTGIYVSVSNQNANLEFMNLKFYALGSIKGINNLAASSLINRIYFENITCYSSNPNFIHIYGLTPSLSSTALAKNVLCFNINNTGATSIVGISGTNCATKDAAALNFPNSFTGITSAHFVSLDPTSDDFLNLVDTSFLISAGTIPSLSANTYGIRGNLRPGDGYYSIGADEYGNSSTRFAIHKLKGTIPFYFRLTDTSDFTGYTSAVDYQRIWSLTNSRTSNVQFFETTSAAIECCISADSLLNDTYTVSLSAVI